MRLLLRNHRGIANRFDSRKPGPPKEATIVAKVTGGIGTKQFNEFMQELDEHQPGAFSQFMFENVGLPDTVNTQEFTQQSQLDELGEENIKQLGLELQWETVSPHLFYPRFNIMRKRANKEIIEEKLNEYDEALNINYEQHISMRLHSQQHVKKKSLELFFHKVDIPIIRTYISQGIHFLTSDFFGRLLSQQKMAILRYLLQQNIFEQADFIDNKFLQIYLAHFLNNPQNDFLLNLVSYQKHLLKGNWPDDEPHYYQKIFYNDKEFVHDMPIMIKDILTRTQNSTDVLNRLRIYWSMQKMYLYTEDNMDLIIEELKYTFFKTGDKMQEIAIKKQIGKLLNSSFSYVPLKQFIYNLVQQSSTFKDFMAFFSVSMVLLSHIRTIKDMVDFDNMDHAYLYQYLDQNLEREQLNPIFLMVFELLKHEDHSRVFYQNFRRTYDCYLRRQNKKRLLRNPSPISSLITKYKNLEFVYQRNPKAPSFTKFTITLDRCFFQSKVNQPPKYFEQKDMIECLVKKDYQPVLNHFLTTFTFTGQKQKVNTFYKKMKDADKNLSFKTKNEQAFYKMKLAKQIFFTHSLPQPLSFLKTKPIKQTYNALTLINDNFIDHDEHLQQYKIMNKYHYADILTRNIKIDNEKYAHLAKQQPDSVTTTQSTAISYDTTTVEETGTTQTQTGEQSYDIENEDQDGEEFDEEVEVEDDGEIEEDGEVEVDQDGNPIQVEVDQDGNPIQVEVDQDGNPIQVEVDQDGNPIQVEVDQDGNPIQVEVDQDGNPIQVEVDQDGNPIQVEVDQDGNPIEANEENEGQEGSEQFDEDNELQQDGSYTQQTTQQSGGYYTSTAQQVPVYPFQPFDDKKMKQFNQKQFMRSIITGILFTPQQIRYINDKMFLHPGEDSQTYSETVQDPTTTQLQEYQKDTQQQQPFPEQQEQQQQQQSGSQQVETVHPSQFYNKSTAQDTPSSFEETQNNNSQEGIQQNQQGYQQSQEQEIRESQEEEQNQQQQSIEGQQQQVEGSQQQQIQAQGQQPEQAEGQQLEQAEGQQNQQDQGEQIQQSQQFQQQSQNQQSQSQDYEQPQQEYDEQNHQQYIQQQATTQSSQISLTGLLTSDYQSYDSTDLPEQYKVKQFKETSTDQMSVEAYILLERQSFSQISRTSLNQQFTVELSRESTIQESSHDSIVQEIIKDVRRLKNSQTQSETIIVHETDEGSILVIRDQKSEVTGQEETITTGEEETLVTGQEETLVTGQEETMVTGQEEIARTGEEETLATGKEATTLQNGQLQAAEGNTNLTGEQSSTSEFLQTTSFQTTDLISQIISSQGPSIQLIKGAQVQTENTKMLNFLQKKSYDYHFSENTEEKIEKLFTQNYLLIASESIGEQFIQGSGSEYTEITIGSSNDVTEESNTQESGQQQIIFAGDQSIQESGEQNSQVTGQQDTQEDGQEITMNEQEGEQDGQEMNQDSQEMIEDSQEMIDDSQEMIVDSQEMIEDGQEMIEDGQEMVEDGQQMNENGQQMIEDGQETNEDGQGMTEDSQETYEDGQQMNEEDFLPKKYYQSPQQLAGVKFQLPNSKKIKKLQKKYLKEVNHIDYRYNDKSAYAYHLLEQHEITQQQGDEKQLQKNMNKFFLKSMQKKKTLKFVDENGQILQVTQQNNQRNVLNNPLFKKRKQDYRKIRKYIQKISDLKSDEQIVFNYNITPQQVFSVDSQQRPPIYQINYKDIKLTEFNDPRQKKFLRETPIYEEQKKIYDQKIDQINHIWRGRRAERVKQQKKAKANNASEVKKQQDVSEEAITELYNSMYKQGVKRQPQTKTAPLNSSGKYNFSKTNKSRFQFCTVSPSTVIHPPVPSSLIDFTKIDQYKTKPVDTTFLRTLQTELQIPSIGSGMILAQYLFLQGKSSTKTSIINPKKTLNIQFTSVVGTRTKNYEQYIKSNLFNYALSQQLYTSLLENQIKKYNRAQFKKIVAHIINFHEEISDNIVRLICKVCENQKIGYTFVEIIELIRVNNVKMSSQALEIVTLLWQKFDIINEDMFPFLKLYTRKMQIPLRTQFYSEFCKSLIKTKKFNKLQIITSAILLELKPKQFKIDSSMNTLKADEVSQIQKQWKLREQQNYLTLYLQLIDVIVTNLDNYVPPFMNEYFDEYLKLKNSLNEKELGLAFICYSHKKDKFVQLLNKLDAEPEKGTAYMYDCLMKSILANFESLQDLTQRSLDTTVLKNRLVLSLPQITKSLTIFKKCSSSNSFSKFLEHCLRFQQTLEQHSDIKRQMFFILNNNVEQVSVGGIFNLLDFIFNEKRAKERIEYRAIKLSEEEKSRKLDLIRGTVTKVNSQESKIDGGQEKKIVKKKGKKNQEVDDEVAVVTTEAKQEEQVQGRQKNKKEQSTDGSQSNKKDQKKKNKKEKKSEREKQASLLDQILAEKQSLGPGEGQVKGANEAQILGMIKSQGKRHESTKRKCIKSMNRLFQGALELQRQEQAAKALEAEKKVLAAKQPVVEKKKGGAEGKKGKK